jgi:hypothetical protein
VLDLRSDPVKPGRGRQAATACRLPQPYIECTARRGKSIGSGYQFPGETDEATRVQEAALTAALQRSEPGVPIAVVLLSFVARHWWKGPLHEQDVLDLRPHLSRGPGVRVIDLACRVEK